MRDRIKIMRKDRRLYCEPYGNKYMVVIEEEFDEDEPHTMYEVRFHCERIQTKLYESSLDAQKVFLKGVEDFFSDMTFETACVRLFGKSDYDIIRLRPV